MSGGLGRLRRGQRFEEEVVAAWKAAAQGELDFQHGVVKPSGRRGRIDIYVRADPVGNLVAVAEVKASDWDAMTEKALRRNVRRQVKQILDYIDAKLAAGHEVCPGVIFPQRPRTLGRLELIEALFEEEGLPVVWEDESVESAEGEPSPPATCPSKRPRTGRGSKASAWVVLMRAPPTAGERRSAHRGEVAPRLEAPPGPP